VFLGYYTWLPGFLASWLPGFLAIPSFFISLSIYVDDPTGIPEGSNKVVVDAEGAVSIGTVMITLGVVLLIVIVVLDIITFPRQIELFRVCISIQF